MYSQPGIYNALDSRYGDPGMSLSDPTGTSNAQALQNTIREAMTDGGGIVLIPATDGSYAQGMYKIDVSGLPDSTISIPYSSDDSQPLLICGTSNATTLLMETPGATLFTVSSNNFTTFQDLTIQWDQANDVATGKGFS